MNICENCIVYSFETFPVENQNETDRGGPRILEKRGHNFPLAQTLFSICPKLAKKLMGGGGGDSNTFNNY